METQQCQAPEVDPEVPCDKPEMNLDPEEESGDECTDLEEVLEQQLKQRLDLPQVARIPYHTHCHFNLF